MDRLEECKTHYVDVMNGVFSFSDMPGYGWLITEVERLRELLKSLEYIDLSPIQGVIPNKRRCPICWCTPKEDGGDGHSYDCKLAAMPEGE
jgi:hypothetical protein